MRIQQVCKKYAQNVLVICGGYYYDVQHLIVKRRIAVQSYNRVNRQLEVTPVTAWSSIVEQACGVEPY